jgi:ADP-ribose pyrophosphatase YjhB (NUDIX family)
MKFVRVTRLGRGKFREEKLDVLGWCGERLMTMEPPGPDQMDCWVLPGGKLWPVEEADQELARTVRTR